MISGEQIGIMAVCVTSVSADQKCGCLGWSGVGRVDGRILEKFHMRP